MTQPFHRALKELKRQYKDPGTVHENYRDVPDQVYLRLFATIQREWNKKKSLPDSAALRLFAYAGWLKFCRWYLPTPFVLSTTMHDNFSKFLRLLKRLESNSDNVAPLELQRIKSDIFSEFHLSKGQTVVPRQTNTFTP